jgi:uncharacterized membrane protein
MKRDWYTLATLIMWMALPITALNYWRVWDRLPMRMAVHFDADWRPNGWTSREGALYLALGTIAFLLVTFTVASYAARVTKPAVAWPLLVVFFLTLAIICLVNNWIAQRNLTEQSSQTGCCGREFPHGRQSGTLTILQLHL